MTKGIIIKSVFENKKLIDFAKRTTNNNDLYKDIISEMLVSISEMDEDKFIELHRSQGLINYCYKIIYLSWNSSNSPFYKKYRTNEHYELITDIQQVSEYNYEIDEQYHKYKERIEYLTNVISEKRYPTEAKVFEIFTEKQSVRATAKQLGLPTMTVWKIIDKFKTKIIQ